MLMYGNVHYVCEVIGLSSSSSSWSLSEPLKNITLSNQHIKLEACGYRTARVPLQNVDYSNLFLGLTHMEFDDVSLIHRKNKPNSYLSNNLIAIQ